MNSTLRTMLVSAAINAAFFSCAGMAQENTSPILLTVETSSLEKSTFSYEELTQFPVSEYKTTTIWTDGIQVFEGVPLKAILEDLQDVETQIKASAVNDYAVNIPLTEINDDAPIIAYRLNGKAMSIREKGPLWLVYPYDLSAQYRTETVYSRSIWQLTHIVLE